MDDSYDREKIVDCMFDPMTSSLIAELEDGEKSSQYLSDKEKISESEVIERFSYLINSGFIFQKQVDGKTMFSANIDKFSKVVEDNENFGATIEGLEKMDSFLN
jgi:hypothetical protein